MRNELIKYGGDGAMYRNNLNDLDGTFDDIGQLISYLRDLSRDLVPLTNSLVPLSENLNDLIENLSSKLEKFFNNNPFFTISGIVGVALLGGYLGTSIIKNIIEIKREIN